LVILSGIRSEWMRASSGNVLDNSAMESIFTSLKIDGFNRRG